MIDSDGPRESRPPLPEAFDERAAPLDVSVPDRQSNHTEEQNSTSSASSSPSHDLKFEYLTWKTEIPLRPVVSEGVTKDLPPQPDLKHYGNPLEWSIPKKRVATIVVCTVNITAAYSAGSYSFPADTLTKKWHISRVVYNLGISLFTVGFGVAPMILAPFSEINGRRPVFVVTGILFVIMQLCCALTESFAGMLVARFLLGCMGSTFSTIVGGILADFWSTAERNTAMVLFSGATLFGTGLGTKRIYTSINVTLLPISDTTTGPLVSGFVAQNLDWRWVFYLQVISSGTLVTLVVFFFKETRGSILLSRKAKLLNKWYEELEAVGCYNVECPRSSSSDPDVTLRDPEKSVPHTSIPTRHYRLRYKVRSDEERVSLIRMISLSLYRPMHLLFTEPVVFWFSCWISFAWAVLYLQFDALPLIYSTRYGFNLQETGAVFAASCIGGILSTFLSIYQEKFARTNPKYREKLDATPEGRLFFTGIESALMPIGMFWFGWTCFSDIHWIVPTIALVFITMGIFSIYLAVFNYTADVYQGYASSALAAAGLCRNLLAGAFPLVTDQMFTGMGYGPASSLLGAVGLLLTAVPWILIFFGPRIRARSKIASSQEGST